MNGEDETMLKRIKVTTYRMTALLLLLGLSLSLLFLILARPRGVRAATFMVINTNDSGLGSLRQAILDANAAGGTNTISFLIPGAGVQTRLPAGGDRR
jgi:hypothetical protein